LLSLSIGFIQQRPTFAKRLGISRQHLNNIVCGNRSPSNLLKKMIAIETQGKIREED